jgi:Leucine-rich repeat (LRR) protein
LDELIESIPADLTELSIANREKSDIIINIPPAISRLKNLEALFLENCIDSLPNEICELKNLAFLTLVNNPKLRSVPECIGNMPNLIFVNFRGSNVEAPAGIKERGSDMGDNMWDMMS